MGKSGDYYTSVNVGNLFGELLAFKFAEWLGEILIPGGRLRIVEAGAHDGQLANDVLTWLREKRPRLFAQTEYCIIEPSSRRQTWQRDKLEKFAPRVSWFNCWGSVRTSIPDLESRKPGLSGIIFSNELLDAMPVHRLGWSATERKWFEWGVTLESDKFAWARIPYQQLIVGNQQLEAVLPDNYTIEISPDAENWWREAASVLKTGRLMTIDYGFTDEEMFLPGREKGTLRSYSHHHATNDLLTNAGEQDLTAHVNFSTIRKAGEASGLTTESFCQQSQFLTRILGETLEDKTFGEWDSTRTRQFQTLTHPEHLGRPFRILVQKK